MKNLISLFIIVILSISLVLTSGDEAFGQETSSRTLIVDFDSNGYDDTLTVEYYYPGIHYVKLIMLYGEHSDIYKYTFERQLSNFLDIHDISSLFKKIDRSQYAESVCRFIFDTNINGKISPPHKWILEATSSMKLIKSDTSERVEFKYNPIWCKREIPDQKSYGYIQTSPNDTSIELQIMSTHWLCADTLKVIPIDKQTKLILFRYAILLAKKDSISWLFVNDGNLTQFGSKLRYQSIEDFELINNKIEFYVFEGIDERKIKVNIDYTTGIGYWVEE